MRWLVEVSHVGDSAASERYCIEAKRWQAALQEARRLRGDAGALPKLTIELLDQGYRAVDPALKVRYVVTEAPAGTPLTEGSQTLLTTYPPPAVSDSQAPSKPPLSARTPSSVPPPVAPARPASVIPPQSYAPPATLASPRPSTGPPGGQVIRQREERATPSNPIEYREVAVAVKPGASRDEITAVLELRLEELRSGLDAEHKRYVQIAVFDHVFVKRPVRPPLATLVWKDWRGDAVVSFTGLDDEKRMSSEPPPSPALSTRAPSWMPSQAPVRSVSAAPLGPLPSNLGGSSLPPRHASVVPSRVLSVGPTEPEPIKPAPVIAAQPSVPPAHAPTPAVAPAARTSVPTAASAARASAPAAVAAPAPVAAALAPVTAAAPAVHASAPPTAVVEPAPVPTRTLAATLLSAPAPAAAEAEVDVAVEIGEEIPISVGSLGTEEEASGARPVAPEPPRPEPVRSEPARPEPVAKPESVPAPTRRSEQPPSPEPARLRRSDPALARRSEPAAAPRRREPGEDLIGDLFESIHELAFMVDLVSGADFVVRALSDVIPCEAILVHAFDLGRREFVVVRARGPNARNALMHRTPDADPTVREVMRRRSVISNGTPPARSGAFEKLGMEPRLLLAAPVRQGGRYLGLIELANPAGGTPFHEAEASALEYVCEQFAEFVASRPIVLDEDVVLGH